MLSDIKGVGAVLEKKLNALGVFFEKDLIGRLPKGYVDPAVSTCLENSLDGDYCLFDAEVLSVGVPFSKGKMNICKVLAKNAQNFISITWFNQPYISKILKVNEQYTFYGKLKIKDNRYTFANPLFEEKGANKKFRSITPIYWTRGIIPQGVYRNIVDEALKTYNFRSVISNELENEFDLPSLQEAYECLHNPKNLDLKIYKDRVLIENIVKRICAYSVARDTKNNNHSTYEVGVNVNDFISELPFSLTVSQVDVIDDIICKLKGEKRFNGILCGDVGSGKTVVAMAIAYFAIKCGHQAAIMAPTEILAYQHFCFASKFLKPLKIDVAFLCGNTKKSEKELINRRLKNGDIGLIIGTHSLISEKVEFSDLSLVIEDEQHRFGVAQRTELVSKGKNVDLLTLSATPIPRSMQLLAYGESDYYTISRRFDYVTKTSIVRKEKRSAMWQYIKTECEKGNQAYVVAPRIFDVEGVEMDSVEALKAELTAVFGSTLGVLHGKMKSEDKENVINDFSKRKIAVLLSTLVIEVGIDVPNAGIIVVMNAERFGLATLHQLRGRVGRDGKQAYCFLYSEKEPDSALKTLCKISDGFEIAEADFDLRGSGDIFGLEQSGASGLEGLNSKSLQKAKKIADRIDLSAARPLLAEEIEKFSLRNVTLN